MSWWRRRSGFDNCTTPAEYIVEMERKLGVLQQIKFKTAMANPHDSRLPELQQYIDEGRALLQRMRVEA